MGDTRDMTKWDNWAQELQRCWKLWGGGAGLDTEAYRESFDEGMSPAEALMEDLAYE